LVLEEIVLLIAVTDMFETIGGRGLTVILNVYEAISIEGLSSLTVIVTV
jgi:hypothetical protein